MLKEELEEACGDRAELETKNAELQRHCDVNEVLFYFFFMQSCLIICLANEKATDI